MTARCGIEQDLAEVRRIVLSRLAGRAHVYLYGSRATGTGGRTSDIDVGVVPTEPLPPGLLSSIREALEDSTVPYPVDVIDLSEADGDFRERVLAGAIEWSN